jgi:hypothetical protein
MKSVLRRCLVHGMLIKVPFSGDENRVMMATDRMVMKHHRMNVRRGEGAPNNNNFYDLFFIIIFFRKTWLPHFKSLPLLIKLSAFSR